MQSRELCMANRCEEAKQLALARLAGRKGDLTAKTRARVRAGATKAGMKMPTRGS